MMTVFGAGGRYTQDMYGLRIQNITTADDGIYYCRAEVDADGRYDEKAIEVIVYSKLEYASTAVFNIVIVFITSIVIGIMPGHKMFYN